VLTGILVAACAALFLSRNFRVHAARARFAPLVHAQELVNAERAEEAIEVLDGVDTRKLDQPVLMHWLGLRGYALALAGRGEEALDTLDDLASLADPEDRLSQLFLNGSRAIVAISDERFDEAEELLDCTERACDDAPNRSEVWWWRAEVAGRRGDEPRRRTCLEEAAKLGEAYYATRARKALQSVAAT
jgi:tetratricopeptide (TPR) repeat protein